MGTLKVMTTKEEAALVVRIARQVYNKYCPAGEAGQINLDELYHHGIIGMLEAKPKFDKSKNVPWLTFAAYRVRGAMLDQLRKSPIIRVPHEKQKKVKDLHKAKMELQKSGKNDSPEVLAEILGWSVEDVHITMTLTPTLIPASGTDQRGEDEYPKHHKIVADTKEIGPEKNFLRLEMLEIVDKCLKQLGAVNRWIFTSRILGDIKLRELAESKNCSTESIRQRQKSSEQQMRSCLEDNGWTADNYLEIIQ